MVLIICTKNESNLTLVLRYGSGRTKSVDGRTERTDGRTDDAKTISLRLLRGIIKTHQIPLSNVGKTCIYSGYMLKDETKQPKRESP